MVHIDPTDGRDAHPHPKRCNSESAGSSSTTTFIVYQFPIVGSNVVPLVTSTLSLPSSLRCRNTALPPEGMSIASQLPGSRYRTKKPG